VSLLRCTTLVSLVFTFGCVAPLHYHRGPAAPASAVQLASQAEGLLRRGEVKAAHKAAKAALSSDAHLAHAHEILVQLAWLRADNDDAWTHLFQSLLDGRDPAALPRLALLPLRPERREELRQLFELLATGASDAAARREARTYAVPLAWAAGEGADAQTKTETLSALRQWRVIGGFDNEQQRGYDTPYGPENELRFDKSYPTSRGTARWRTLSMAEGRTALALRDQLYPTSWNTAYLASFVRVPKAGAATLWLRSTDAVKVWINDRLVLATRGLVKTPRFAMRIPVNLRRGFNKVLVKSCQSDAGWGISMGFSDAASGKPLKVDVSLAMEKTARDLSSRAKTFNQAWVVPSVVGGYSDEARRSFWHALMLARAGFSRLAVTALRAHLESWPKDGVALYIMARLAAQAGQRQVEAKLIARGLVLPWPYRRGFALQRARSLRKRDQHDRALELLREIKGQTQREGGDVMMSRAWIREMDLLLTVKGWQLDRCRLMSAAARREPRRAELHAQWASCLGSLGREKKALEHLRRAVTLAPLDRGYRAALGQATMALGGCKEARRLQRRSTELFASDPGEWVRLGDFARRCGSIGRALAHYRKAARLRPGWARPLQKEGSLHYEAGRLEKALEKWRAALRLDVEDASLWDRVHWIRPEKDPILDALQPTDKEIAAAIADARKTQPLPGASVLWLLDHEASRLLPDGTMKRVVTIVRMPVDRAGRDSLGEAKLPSRGLVKVLDAYVIDREGGRREVTSLHSKKVRYPALKEGSVLVLRYRHTRHPGGYLRQHLATSWFFQHSMGQVARAQWVLAIPKERKLSVALQGKVEHRVTERKDVTIHRFTALDVPPLRPERHSPSRRDLLRSVTVSTVPSWDYFSSWGRSLTNEVFEVTPDLKRKVKALVKGAKTAQEKIARVYHFAIKEVRYQQDYETFIAGVKPHTAGTVLARGYGDCKDKTVLIIAMLRHLGLDAEFALIRVRRAGKVARHVPYQQFNHAVVYVPKQSGLDKARFLDATAENLDLSALRADVQGTLALVLSGAGHQFVEVPYQAPRHNSSMGQLTLKLDAKGNATGVLDWRLEGQRAGALRKPLQNAEMLRQLGQSVVHRIYAGGRLLDAKAQNQRDVRSPLQVKLVGRFSNVAEREDAGLRLRLPRLLSIANWATWTMRRHPLFFGPPQQTSMEVLFTLPAGFQPRTLPEDVKIEARCLHAKGHWSFEEARSELRYVQRVTRRCVEIAPADYGRFRDHVNALERAINREVVLVQGKKEAKGSKRKARERKGR